MFWQQIVNGVSLGAIYALITIGYSMVYGIMKMMNFAHGDVYMFGTFLTYTLLTALKCNLVTAVLVGLVVGAILAALVEILAYRPLRTAPQGRTISMITALGAAYIIQNGEEIFWGVEPQRFPAVIGEDAINLLGLSLSKVQLFTLAFSVLLLILFHFFLKHHKVGKAILCLSQDVETSSLMGIPINRTVSIVFAIGGMLGVVGGILYSAAYNVISIAMGFSGTIVAFTACVFGGIGSLGGALVGSLVVGLCQSLAGAYISTTFRDVITFTLLIVLLLIRPEGLLGRRTKIKV
ncbi:MAG: branched-chain amino acid ABC transporter permease [Pseudomonadota bacterium]